MKNSYRHRWLGELILEFSEFLQRLFESSEDEESSVKKIKDTLNQSNLTISDFAEKPISKLKTKLEQIDSRTLDLIVVFLYEQSQKENENLKKGDLKGIKSTENLNSRISELIEYLNIERKTFSLDRNNIKNSLEHQS